MGNQYVDQKEFTRGKKKKKMIIMSFCAVLNDWFHFHTHVL